MPKSLNWPRKRSAGGARALCLGSTETNIVKQRKHKLKGKLPTELMDFIFKQ